MEKSEALQIVKSVMDIALSSGIIKNLEDASKVIQAYSILATPEYPGTIETNSSEIKIAETKK